jgi:hypothetical protein
MLNFDACGRETGVTRHFARDVPHRNKSIFFLTIAVERVIIEYWFIFAFSQSLVTVVLVVLLMGH